MSSILGPKHSWSNNKNFAFVSWIMGFCSHFDGPTRCNHHFHLMELDCWILNLALARSNAGVFLEKDPICVQNSKLQQRGSKHDCISKSSTLAHVLTDAHIVAADQMSDYEKAPKFASVYAFLDMTNIRDIPLDSYSSDDWSCSFSEFPSLSYALRCLLHLNWKYVLFW